MTQQPVVGTDNPQPTEPGKPWFKKWWVWIVGIFVLWLLVPSGGNDEPEATPEPTVTVTETVAAEPTQTPEETTEAPEPEEAAESPARTIEVLDLSDGSTRFVSATFPVSDAFTRGGILSNLHEGCVEAIQAAKDQTDDWWDYDIVQCMGLADWTDDVVAVGSANFTGALLADISDVEMQSDPEAFWNRADKSTVLPELRD